MIALINQVPSEAKIRKYLRQVVFGKNMTCPNCNSRQVYRSEDRYRCRKCRKPFTLLSGTWLSNMKLSLRTFWALLWCWTQQVPVLQTQKLYHVSERTVYHWFRQFRLRLPDFEPILEGTVQMDEAYFKKLSLVMAKQVGSKKIAHQFIFKNSVDKNEAARFLFQHIKPKTKLHTDPRWPLENPPPVAGSKSPTYRVSLRYQNWVFISILFFFFHPLLFLFFIPLI